MNRLGLLTACVVLIGLAYAFGASPKQKEPQRPQWEYRVCRLSVDSTADRWEDSLLSLGREGWEVAATAHIPYSDSAKIMEVRAILKRPK